jgi:hypothetical protein
VRFMVSDPKRFAQVISAQESIIDRGSGRGTLEGIAVYSVEGGIATVATNGAILVAYRFPADPIADPVADLSCIENWAMLSFIRSPSRGAISGALKPLCSGSFLPISFSEGTMTAAHGGATVAIGEISEYPDWRKIVPKRDAASHPCNRVCFNTELVKAFTLRGINNAVWSFASKGQIIWTDQKDPNFFALLMQQTEPDRIDSDWVW